MLFVKTCTKDISEWCLKPLKSKMNTPWNSGRNHSMTCPVCSCQPWIQGPKKNTCTVIWRKKNYTIYEGMAQCIVALDSVLGHAEEHFCTGETCCIFKLMLYLKGNCRHGNSVKKQSKFDYMFSSKIASFWCFCVDFECPQKQRSYPVKPLISILKVMDLKNLIMMLVIVISDILFEIPYFVLKITYNAANLPSEINDKM